jgi:hypothetical protein
MKLLDKLVVECGARFYISPMRDTSRHLVVMEKGGGSNPNCTDKEKKK